MILESIVTTLDPDGEVNLAPMGPWINRPDAMRSAAGGDPGFVLRPFEGSRTCTNLMATRRATVHVTDDAVLFADTAVGRLPEPASLVTLSKDGRYAILNRCHRWFSIRVESASQTPPRYELHCRLVDSGIKAPFFGFNRGKHAIIEAAILATRTHLIPPDEIRDQIERLRPLVEKTAGAEDADAFTRLVAEIESRIAAVAGSGKH